MLLRSLSKVTAPIYKKSCGSACAVLKSTIRMNHELYPSNIVFMDGAPEKKTKELLPEITKDVKKSRLVTDTPNHRQPVVAWLHDFVNFEDHSAEAIELHPEVFAGNPKMNFLCNAVEWQNEYREVDYTWKPTRADVGFGRRKPWPQKGTGRARHGSTNAPQWKNGGKANAPRGPVALYYEQPIEERIEALTSALTVRQIQNDLLIIKDFKIDPETENLNFDEIFKQHAIEEDSSMLIVHHSSAKDVTENSFKVLEEQRKVNIMSVIALNVYSILKHDKLVLTLDAALELETKLMWHKYRYDWLDKPHNFYTGIPFVNEDVEDFAEETTEEVEAAAQRSNDFDVIIEEFEELDSTDLPYGRM